MHGIQRILLLLYGPRLARTMHVEFLVKTPTEIYSMRDLRADLHPEDSPSVC